MKGWPVQGHTLRYAAGTMTEPGQGCPLTITLPRLVEKHCAELNCQSAWVLGC